MPPKGQRYRGLSFKQEYMPKTTLSRLKSKVSGGGRGGRKRAPSMYHGTSNQLIPPKSVDDRRRYTVVLDLDETLIYAREGPLYARPRLEELLSFLGENCEAVVWTAGVRAYAQAVLRNIDHNGAIDHCVYRHEKWFTGQAGYVKDLALVGRDVNYLLMIENTPDCIRGWENNGILVADYEGGETPDDPTLPVITELLTELVNSGLPVPEFLRRTPLLTKQYVATDVGDQMVVYCLDPNKATADRVNRDLPAK